MAEAAPGEAEAAEAEAGSDVVRPRLMWSDAGLCTARYLLGRSIVQQSCTAQHQ